jgi:arylsulfatase A-like enzyme
VEAVRLRPLQLVLLTLWFSLAAATAELLVRGFQKVALGQIVRLSRDAIWLAPPGQLMLYGSAAVLLALIGLGWRRATTPRTVFVAFTFIASLGLLLIPGLNVFAACLLAAGLAWRLTGLADRGADRFLRFARATAPVLAILLAAAAAAAATLRTVGEQRAVGRLGTARDGAPSVILVIWDTVRATSLSLHGHARPTTPNLENLARRGVLFERAFATSPWTLPSHASFFTGYLPHELSTHWNTPLDGAHPTLAEVFRANGYLTGGFAANLLYTDWEHGLDRGFIHFEDYRVSTGQAFASTALGRALVTGRQPWELTLAARLLGYRGFVGRVTADDVDRNFLRWLDERDGERPVFAFLNYFDAHFPFQPPDSVAARFPPRRPPSAFLQRIARELRRKGPGDLMPAELEAERAAYEASIAHLDSRLGRLVRQLELRGMLENTLLIVASDHGEEFREHGALGHGGNLYLPQLHVPLVIVQPGVLPAGIRVPQPVSLRDLPATIAGLARLENGDVFPGFSLERTWRDARPGVDTPQAVLAELSPGRERESRFRSITVGRYQLIRNPDGRPELYDIVADPEQRTDLAQSLERSFDVWRFDAVMNRLFGCTGFNCCCAVQPRSPAEAGR